MRSPLFHTHFSSTHVVLESESMNIEFPEITSVNCWSRENDEIQLAVDKTTGWIRAAKFKASGVDPFAIRKQNIPGNLGYLRVYDELDGRWYHDLKDRSEISDVKQSGNSVTFTKTFAGAPF